MLTLQLNNLGLYTYANTVGQVPPGAMVAASNVVIDRPGVVETRRGFKSWGTTLTGTIHKLFPYKNRLVAHHGTSLAYDSDGAGTWVDYSGTFAPITGDTIRGVEANQNFYFTTNNGIYKLDSLTGNPYKAGGTAALDTTAALSGVTGFLANGYQCAYRITWVWIDANGNQIEGNPSPSVTINNASGGTRNVDVTFTVPSQVTTSFYYRVYRTQQSTVTPGDTMYLAYEGKPTAGQITALAVTVTDITPDALLGLLLYTSQGAEGQFQTNDPPPLANDICTFQGMTFYFNCSTIQQFYITMIAVGAPNGVQVGDTISLVGTATNTYTGAAANNFVSHQFKVDTTGTVAQNIDATARNLVSAINQDPNNSEFYAGYLSGYNQLPGQILIYARNLGHAAFTATSSRGTAYSPTIPSSGITYISTNNQVVNGFYVSKSSQPEAVPTENLQFIGTGANSASFTIYRGIALRDAVVVLTKGGVFRITGTSPSTLTVQPFDNTVVVTGIDTAVPLNNSVYTYTTQAEVSVTESGSQIISRNVEGDLLQLSAMSNFASLAFGCAYESDRKYILFAPATLADTTATIQYVYNWITQSFTTWNIPATCAVVNPNDNRLYIGGTSGKVLQERKSFTVADYADDETAVTIVSQNGTSVVLTSAASAVIGYSLGQGVSNGVGGITGVITGVDTNTNTVTLATTPSFSLGAAAIFAPVNASITYAPLTCGYPTYIKRFQPVMQFIFSQANFINATVNFNTDIYPANESVTLTPKSANAWGTFAWGTIPWGVTTANLQSIPTFLTRNTTMCHWLNITVSLNQAFQNLALDGITGFYDLVGQRNR
jgi:hypothetical protein